MNTGKVSIITVAYNSAETLGNTLRSVASQDYKNIEHILVDGGSADRTKDVVRQHGAHLARYVSERDTGIYNAMNKGLRMATGDWVGCLNADDVLAGPDVISRIMANVQVGAGDKSVDLVYGDLEYVQQFQPPIIVRRWNSGTFSIGALRFGWMPPHPTFYLRRGLLDAVGFYDESLRIAADYDFMLRCLKRNDVRVVKVPGVLVRMLVGGASNRSLSAMLRKSSEDLIVMRRHGVGGFFTLLCKNFRKIGQFFR